MGNVNVNNNVNNNNNNNNNNNVNNNVNNNNVTDNSTPILASILLNSPTISAPDPIIPAPTLSSSSLNTPVNSPVISSVISTPVSSSFHDDSVANTDHPTFSSSNIQKSSGDQQQQQFTAPQARSDYKGKGKGKGKNSHRDGGSGGRGRGRGRGRGGGKRGGKRGVDGDAGERSQEELPPPPPELESTIEDFQEFLKQHSDRLIHEQITANIDRYFQRYKDEKC